MCFSCLLLIPFLLISVNSLQPSYLFSRYRFGFLWHISYIIWDSLPTFCSRFGGFAVTFYLAYWYLRKSSHINYNSASSGSCQWSFGSALSHCPMFIVSHSFNAPWDMESGIWLHSDTFTQRPGFSVQVCLNLALKSEHRAYLCSGHTLHIDVITFFAPDHMPMILYFLPRWSHLLTYHVSVCRCRYTHIHICVNTYTSIYVFMS